MIELKDKRVEDIENKNLMFRFKAELEVEKAIADVRLIFEVAKATDKTFKIVDPTVETYERYTEAFKDCFEEINNIITNTIIPTFEGNFRTITTLSGRVLFGFDVFITPTEQTGFYVASQLNGNFGSFMESLDLKQKLVDEMYSATESISKSVRTLFMNTFKNVRGGTNGR